MTFALIVIAGLLIAATILALLRRDEWWIRFFDFPRLQIILLGLATLGAGLKFFDLQNPFAISVWIALLLCMLYQGKQIYRYTRLAPKQVQSSCLSQPNAAISLLIANVLMGNRKADSFLEIIQQYDPDLVLAVETDPWWEERLCTVEARYPYRVKHPLDNTYGMLLYSRLELVNPEIKFLVQPNIPSIHTQVRLRSGALTWLHCVHPEPPSPTEAETSTERDAELLIVGRAIRDRGETPTIVVGDLNDVAWSYTTRLFQRISGLLDPRIGRGMFNTFHAKIPLLRWPLDHVFHSDEFRLVALGRAPAFGSDHFPVYIRLSLEPAAELQQEEPESTGEDQAQAREKITAVNQRDAV